VCPQRGGRAIGLFMVAPQNGVNGTTGPILIRFRSCRLTSSAGSRNQRKTSLARPCDRDRREKLQQPFPILHGSAWQRNASKSARGRATTSTTGTSWPARPSRKWSAERPRAKRPASARSSGGRRGRVGIIPGHGAERALPHGGHQNDHSAEVHLAAENRTDCGVTRFRQPSRSQQKLNRQAYSLGRCLAATPAASGGT